MMACSHQRTKRYGRDRRGKQRTMCLDCGVTRTQPDADIEDLRGIGEVKAEAAITMFIEHASIRQVSRAVGISGGTAHEIQRAQRCADHAIDGRTRVLTGRRADGSHSFYETTEVEPQWRGSRYGDVADFEGC